MRSNAAGRSARVRRCRSRSSPANVTSSFRPLAPRRSGSKVPNLVFDRTIAGAGHNDIYQRPEFQQAMREALATLR